MVSESKGFSRLENGLIVIFLFGLIFTMGVYMYGQAPRLAWEWHTPMSQDAFVLREELFNIFTWVCILGTLIMMVLWWLYMRDKD